MTKRTEKLFRALRMLLAAACLMALCSFAAFGADQRVYDAAGLFSADKVSEIEAEIVSVREKTGLDIAVVTTTNKQGLDTQAYADALYEQGNFGVGQGHNGLLYLIDMEDRVPCLSTEGGAIDLLSDSEIERILENTYDYLGSGDYAGSALSVVRDVQGSYDDAIAKGWTYDQAAGTWTAPVKKKTLNPFKVLVSAVVSFFAGFGSANNIKRKYTLKDMAAGAGLSTASMLVAAGCAFAFAGQADDLVNSFTERRALPRIRSGGGGGGGPHGHSTVHTSSAGRTHGGGVGRKF